MNKRLQAAALYALLGLTGACSTSSSHSVPQTTAPPPLQAIILPAPSPQPARVDAPAQTERDARFRAFLDTVGLKAAAAGVRRATIDAVLPGLGYNQRVVDLDRSQPDDSSPSAPPLLSGYLGRRLDPVRIARGKSRYTSLQPQLAAMESRFGVPGSILLGIWGMETNYGSYMGDFDLFRSLASLAYDGRRRDLFMGELIAALQIVDRGLASRSALVGSWAGAMGNPQFLPSSYLASAIDGDGDGKADIWRSDGDTLASIANYLAKAGWKRGEPWGLEVRTPAGLDRNSLVNPSVSSSCPRVHARHSRWMTVAQWRALSLVTAEKDWPADTLRATLLEPDGPNGRAFLAFENYRALLSYNCSNFYVISVGLLADAVSN